MTCSRPHARRRRLHPLVVVAVAVAVIFQWCERAEGGEPSGVFCNKDTKIGSGKKASAKLLVELVSKASRKGYWATSIGYGDGKQAVYGLAQCRGDVLHTDDCSACLQDAADHIRARCPDQADARIWFDYCFLRYSNKEFMGEVDTGFGIYYYNVNNVTGTAANSFNRELGKLMEKIRTQAVDPKSAGMGKGETKLTPFLTLYALQQCTRDLSPLSCAQCLATAVSNFPDFCNNKKGCRVLYSSCYTRYELYPFFFPITSSPFNFSHHHTRIITVYPQL